MIRWRLYLLALVCCLPFVAGQARPAQKPIMFVIHADWCAPCRNFDRVWCDRRDVRDALHDAFEVRELDWEVPAQQAEAIGLGVTQVPSYVVIRGNRRLAMSVGFTTRQDRVAVNTAVARLMADLFVEWPRVRTDLRSDLPDVSAASPPVQSPVPRPECNPQIDQKARDAVDQLASHSRELQQAQEKTAGAVESLQTDVAEVRSIIGEVQSHVEQSREAITHSLEESQASTQTELRSMADRLRESIERNRESIPPNGESITVPGESSPDISTEIPIGPTASKWLNVGAWIAKVGVAVAAPEFALPLSVGLGAAGWLVNRFRRGQGLRPDTFPGRSVPAGPVRDNSEVEQILSLRQQEQRDPVHDALFGVLFEDEYRAKPDQPIKEAWHSAMDRFNNIAPLSTTSKTVTSTTSTKGT